MGTDTSSRVRFCLPPIEKTIKTVTPVVRRRKLIRSKTYDIIQSQTSKSLIKSPITRDKPVSLSLDDICHLAEKERLCYSARTRREAVEIAQNTTHKFDEYPVSRPHTSASRYINDIRRDAMTPKSIRSEPVPSRVNSRLGATEFEDDDEDSVYPLNLLSNLPVGRECCEIIGPQVCSQCKQAQFRQMGLESCEQCFPTLRVSYENMTTAAVLQRYLPGLTEGDIQDKIARGEIAKPRLLRKRSPKKESQIEKKNSQDSSERRSESKNKNPSIRPSSMFFVNIRDLNAKIVSGQLHRAIGFSENVQKEVLRRQENRRKLQTPKPKPETDNTSERKERKAKFNPDILLSVSMQVNEPSFFAGRKQEYQLPERLPDPLSFVDIRDKKALESGSTSLCGLEEEPEDVN